MDLDVLVQGPCSELEQVVMGVSAEDESFCLRVLRNCAILLIVGGCHWLECAADLSSFFVKVSQNLELQAADSVLN